MPWDIFTSSLHTWWQFHICSTLCIASRSFSHAVPGNRSIWRPLSSSLATVSLLPVTLSTSIRMILSKLHLYSVTRQAALQQRQQHLIEATLPTSLPCSCSRIKLRPCPAGSELKDGKCCSPDRIELQCVDKPGKFQPTGRYRTCFVCHTLHNSSQGKGTVGAKPGGGAILPAQALHELPAQHLNVHYASLCVFQARPLLTPHSRQLYKVESLAVVHMSGPFVCFFLQRLAALQTPQLKRTALWPPATTVAGCRQTTPFSSRSTLWPPGTISVLLLMADVQGLGSQRQWQLQISGCPVCSWVFMRWDIYAPDVVVVPFMGRGCLAL